jgi:hypothetical protein
MEIICGLMITSFLRFSISILAKRVVVTLEPGYGIFRKLRSGYGRNKNYITDYNWDDGLFIKLSASYRIRL